LTLSGTLSQCSSRSNGVVWSYFLAEKTSRTAALRTDWSRSSKTSGAPAISEPQKSSLLITRDRSKVSMAGRGRLHSCRTTRKTRDSFINWTCGKLSHIFSSANFNSETVFGFGWRFQNSFVRRSPDTISSFQSNLETY